MNLAVGSVQQEQALVQLLEELAERPRGCLLAVQRQPRLAGKLLLEEFSLQHCPRGAVSDR